MSASGASLSGRLFFQPVHDRNIHSVRLLVSTVLPVAYSDAFFKRLAAGGTPAELASLAYFDDIFVGCVAARVEPERRAVYLMVLGVLAPYRHRGIGAPPPPLLPPPLPACTLAPLPSSHPPLRHVFRAAPRRLPPRAGAALLQRVLAAAESGEHGDIAEVWLHVHTGNAAAQAFYEAQGFTRSPGEWKGYYRGVEPPDAFVYRRAVGAARLEDLPAPTQAPSGATAVDAAR